MGPTSVNVRPNLARSGPDVFGFVAVWPNFGQHEVASATAASAVRHGLTHTIPPTLGQHLSASGPARCRIHHILPLLRAHERHLLRDVAWRDEDEGHRPRLPPRLHARGEGGHGVHPSGSALASGRARRAGPKSVAEVVRTSGQMWTLKARISTRIGASGSDSRRPVSRVATGSGRVRPDKAGSLEAGSFTRVQAGCAPLLLEIRAWAEAFVLQPVSTSDRRSHSFVRRGPPAEQTPETLARWTWGGRWLATTGAR